MGAWAATVLAGAALLAAACATGANGDGAADRLVGVDVRGEVQLEVARAPASSGRTDAGRYLASLQLDADLEPLVQQPGRVFADFRSNRGDEFDGATHGTSSLEAEATDQISELFYQRDLFDGDLRVRVGVLDGNREFAAVDAAAGFFNPAPATTPAWPTLPTWPSTAPGAEVIVGPDAPVGLALGAYDLSNLRPLAASDVERPEDDGVYFAAELRSVWSPSDTRVALGASVDTGLATRADGSQQDGYDGYYLLVEQPLTGLGAGLRTFAIHGSTDAAVAEVARHTALGAAFEGWWSRRPTDEIGCMVSHLVLGQVAPDGGEELAVEAYYRAALTDSAAVSLSVQMADGDTGSGIVIALRGSFSL